jgi:hypothetical protein
VAAPDQLYRAVTWIFSVIVIGFGLAILVITFANGGGFADAGFWLGLLFLGIGIARLVIAMRNRS